MGGLSFDLAGPPTPTDAREHKAVTAKAIAFLVRLLKGISCPPLFLFFFTKIDMRENVKGSAQVFLLVMVYGETLF